MVSQKSLIEHLTVDIEETHQGTVMKKLGERRGELQNMLPDGKGQCVWINIIPTRGLIGFHTEFLSSMSGTGLMYHVFENYGPLFAAALANQVMAYSLLTAKVLHVVLPYLICKSEVVSNTMS